MLMLCGVERIYVDVGVKKAASEELRSEESARHHDAACVGLTKLAHAWERIISHCAARRINH